MLYCSKCIDSIILPKTRVLKQENAKINISSGDNFVCSNCKKVIICDLKNNNVQTKDLKNNNVQTKDLKNKKMMIQ